MRTLALLLVLGSAEPGAAERPRVGVLPVELVGDKRPNAAFTVGLLDGLARGKLDLTRLDADCAAPTCWRAIQSPHPIGQVVRARVTAEHRVFRVVIEALSVETGAVLVSSREDCVVCGLAEVEDLIRQQAAALASRLTEPVLGAPRLRVESGAVRASVYLDKTLVGVTPIELDVTPGRHTVRVEHPGYVAAQHGFSAVAGLRENWQVELRRAPVSARIADKQPRQLAIGGGIALAGGLGSLVTGATFLGLAGRPVRSRCSGSDRDGDGDCRLLYNTTTHGAVFTAIGVAATVVGATLIGLAQARVRARRASRRDREASR